MRSLALHVDAKRECDIVVPQGDGVYRLVEGQTGTQIVEGPAKWVSRSGERNEVLRH
jgi:hypothetical protein